MSAQDFASYGAPLRQFVGRHLAVSVPTNSIKLMVDRERHTDNYIWVDPPWTLLQNGIIVAASASYPSPEDDDYLVDHEAWGAVVRGVLDGAQLEGVTALSDGTVDLTFEGGVCLRLHPGEGDDETLWYDDWYAKAGVSNREQP